MNFFLYLPPEFGMEKEFFLNGLLICFRNWTVKLIGFFILNSTCWRDFGLEWIEREFLEFFYANWGERVCLLLRWCLWWFFKDYKILVCRQFCSLFVRIFAEEVCKGVCCHLVLWGISGINVCKLFLNFWVTEIKFISFW